MSYTSGYYSGYNKKICQKIYSYGIMPIVDKKENEYWSFMNLRRV